MTEYKYLENPIPKHIVEQIKADAIDEISNALDELDMFCDNDHWTSDGSMMWKIHEVRQILEQLKEQKND